MRADKRREGEERPRGRQQRSSMKDHTNTLKSFLGFFVFCFYLKLDFFFPLLFFYLSGFIDFIVEPSFQVMGDMLERVMSPLQHQGMPPSRSGHIDEAISEEVFEGRDKRDKSTSTTSLLSRAGTPKAAALPCECRKFFYEIL